MGFHIRRFFVKFAIGISFFKVGCAMQQDAAPMKKLQHMYRNRRRNSLLVIGRSAANASPSPRRDIVRQLGCPSSRLSTVAPKPMPPCLPPLPQVLPRSSSVDPTRTTASYRGPVTPSMVCALYLKRCTDNEEDKELLTARALPVSERQKTASCKIVEAWMVRNGVASDRAKHSDGLDVIVPQASPQKRRVRFPPLLPERTVAQVFPKTPPQRQQECAVSTNSSDSESEEPSISFYNNGAQILSCKR